MSGWWLADVADCIYCGEPCTEWDNDGNPIHEQCRIDRDVMQAEAAWHAWSGE